MSVPPSCLSPKCEQPYARQSHPKVAQNSSQHIPRLFTPTRYQLMLQSWYQNRCPITGEHVGIIFVTK